MEKKTTHTKKELEYIQKYQNEHYEKLTIKVNRDKMFKSRLDTLCISTGMSRNQLLIEAVERLLREADL